MRRLIDANALCEFFQERYEYLRNASETPLPGGKVLVDTEIQCGAIIAKEFLDKANDAPTVDAVEVVRCKDCKHFGGHGVCHCHAADENGTPIFVREDDFCSYGERKDNGNNI